MATECKSTGSICRRARMCTSRAIGSRPAILHPINVIADRDPAVRRTPWAGLVIRRIAKPAATSCSPETLRFATPLWISLTTLLAHIPRLVNIFHWIKAALTRSRHISPKMCEVARHGASHAGAYFVRRHPCMRKRQPRASRQQDGALRTLFVDETSMMAVRREDAE